MGRSGGGGGGPAMLLVAAVLVAGAAVSNAQLKVGFYSKSCPTAESTVASAVRQFADADSTILPALVRLQFHDCFAKVHIHKNITINYNFFNCDIYFVRILIKFN